MARVVVTFSPLKEIHTRNAFVILKYSRYVTFDVLFAKVMAFEPLPSTAALFRASLRFNDARFSMSESEARRRLLPEVKAGREPCRGGEPEKSFTYIRFFIYNIYFIERFITFRPSLIAQLLSLCYFCRLWLYVRAGRVGTEPQSVCRVVLPRQLLPLYSISGVPRLSFAFFLIALRRAYKRRLTERRSQ